MIVKLAEGKLRTTFGDYTEVLYYDGQKESVAMILGDIQGKDEVLCRLHSACLYGHYFNSLECDCRQQMELSQQLIQQAGKGIIILLDQEGKGNGHFALLQSKIYKQKGFSQADAYEAAGFKKDARDYHSAAKILQDVGVKSIRLLTDNASKADILAQYGVNVTGILSTTISSQAK